MSLRPTPVDRRAHDDLAQKKLFGSAAEAVADVLSGASLGVGGFGVCGVPFELIEAIHSSRVTNLRIFSNNLGVDDVGLGILLADGQISSVVASYVGENQTFERLFLNNELDVELVPQGTLAERLRAGGAGIPAFYTPTGAGTSLTDGRETRDFDGRACVLEAGVTTDFGLVRAWRGDRFGNLAYRRTARNFNPVVAMAAKVTIAEIEELVEPGELDGDAVHTPGAFVQRVIVAPNIEKPIERRTTRAT